MLRTFKNKILKAEVQTITKGDNYYFKARDVSKALEYENLRSAVKDLVSPEYKTTLSEMKGSFKIEPLKNAQPHSVFIKEYGLYELIFKSNKPAAKDFRKWVFEDVLPSIRKTGQYSVFNTKNPLVFKIENENDLHFKVVDYIRRRHPNLIFIAGLGEQQDTSERRIHAWKKGYTKGQPDIIITNYHKWYTGLCLEFKTPKGNGVTSEAQRNLLEKYKMNGYKILICNDYDLIVEEIIEYSKGIRIPCPHCCKRFVLDKTLKAHLKWFHRIEE